MTFSKAKLKQTFGPFSRFAIIRRTNRFGGWTWFIEDAETIDEVTELPEVIAQSDDFIDISVKAGILNSMYLGA